MIKGAVLLVTALALVEGASLRDEGWKCTQGPEYWCSSVEQADECAASQYCIEYVWVVEEVEEVGDSSMKCAACEWVTSEALKMLEKESTEAEMLVVLEGLCDKIPFVGAECHTYVAEMGPTVLKMLEGMVSADKICQTLQLCTVMENFNMENDFVKYIIGPKIGDDKCTMCVDGLKELQVILKDKKMLDIIEAVTTLFCSNFPLPQCQSLMESYITKYINIAEAWDVNSECVKTKACAAFEEDNLTEVFEVVEDIEVRDTPGCDACIDGVKELKKVWADDDTQALVKVAISEVCTLLGVPDSTCSLVSEMILPQITTAIAGLVPKDTCVAIGACTASTEIVIVDIEVRDTPGCDACIDGIKEMKKVWADDDTQAFVKVAISEVCILLGVPDSTCSLVSGLVLPQITTAIAGLVPKDTCVKLGSCTAATEIVIVDIEIQQTLGCDACIDGLKELKTVWADESTQALVKIVISEVCVLLGVPDATCSLVSGLVLPQISSAIAGLVPKDACVKIGACTAATDLGMTPFSDDSFPCEFCEFMGEQGIRRLFTNKTEKALIATAKKVCAKVPLFSMECSNAVDQYALAFMNKVRDTNFHYLCGKFMLCDPEIQEWVKSLSLYKAIVSEESSSEDCDACMDGIDEIKEIFTDEDTQALIHIAIEAACDSLTTPIPQCEKVLKMTFDGFLMQLAKVDNHDICAQYGMCPSEGLTAAAIDDSFTCEYCEFIGDQFVKRMFTNETETIVLAYTQKVCAKVPSFLGKECTALVDKYGYYYLGELKKVLNVEKSCEKFNLCNPAGKLFLESSSLVKVMLGQETSDGIMCDACDKGLQYALNYLQSPSAQANMKSYALAACRMYGMPDNVCEGIVFGLIEGFNKELSTFEPKVACIAFNMCDAPVYPMKEMFQLAADSFPCDVCMFAGDEFVERILTYEAVTKVLDIARQTCAYVPLFSQECTTFIDESGEDQIYKWISKIDINKLCSEIHLCQASNKTLETLPPLPEQLEGFICDTCEFFGHEFIERLLTNDTVKGAMVVARKVCSAIPLYSQECTQFIDTQGFYWMNLWISELNADNFCSKLTLCPSGNGTVFEAVAELSPVAASIQCDTCMFVGNEFIEKAFTEDNIKMALSIGKAVCAKVPVFSQECGDFIDSDGEELIHTLISMVHVDKICSMIKLCPAKALNDIFPNPDHGFICDTCEYFGHEFIQRILTKESKQKTLAVARKGCTYVPLYSAECQRFVDEDGDYFLTTWITSLSVDRFCSKISLCKPDLVKESIAESLGLTASIQCDVCMFVGNEFVEKAFTDDTIGFAIMLAHEACSYIPLFSKECMEAVEQDGEKLIRMALSHVHIDQICGEIHLCPAKTLEETLPNPNQGFVCDTCQYFGHEFVERVLTKDARKKTLDVVRKACSIIPLYAAECQKVVDEEGEYYLNLWIDELDMDGLCMKLQICNPAFKTWYETSAIPQLLEEAKLPDCDTCVEGFDELKKIVNDPYTKEMVTVLTKEACLSLPIPFCNSVMRKVVAHIEEAVDAINSAAQCKKMGACPGRVTEQEDHFNVMMASLSPVLMTPVTESTCDTCVEGFERVKDMLADPYTEKMMRVIVAGLCDGVDHIPRCQMILNPVLDWILKVEIDSNRLCTFFGICSTPKVFLDVTSDYCDDCVEGLDEVKKMLTDPTMRVALKAMAEEFCSYAAMPVSMCNYGVDSLIDMAVDKLAKIDSTNTCSFFGVCSANPMTSVSEGYCEDCIEGMDEFKEIFADPLIRESMHLISTEMCAKMPIPGCVMIMNKIFDFSIDKLSNIDSKHTCSFFGVCSANPMAGGDWCADCIDDVEEWKSVLPYFKESFHLVSMEICTQIPIPGCSMFFNKIFDYSFDKIAAIRSERICSFIGACSAKPNTFVTEGYCEDCIEGIEEFKTILADPLIRESMHLLISTEICPALPIPGCSMILSKIYDYITDKLASVDSKHTCSIFGVCSADHMTSFTEGFCEDCIEGFEELKQVILDPTVALAMKSMAGEACQTLPIPMCEYILNSYIDTIISSVASIDSNATCAYVGACDGQYSNAGEVVRSLVSALPVGSAPCDMCTAQIEEIKQMAADPAVIAVVKDTVDEVCAMLPLVGQACKTTLENYIDEAAEAVLELDSKAMCSFMGLC